MITAGIDIGSITTKAVIMNDSEILSQAIIRSKPKPEESASEIFEKVKAKCSITQDEIQFIIATGYGKDRIPFAQETESEISCHAKGVWWQDPSVHTIIDIGGQDAKAIKLDDSGNINRYIYNDKCASGTGRFLEIMAEALELNLEELGTISQKSKQQIHLSNQCVVFAETEIISLVNDGKDLADIINALHRAVAGRVAALAKSLVIEDNVALTGGVAKNSGMSLALQHALHKKLVPLNHDPQINGAIGAALFAQEKSSSNTSLSV